MTTTSREFDSFGPWIDEVRAADDVPRLFRTHPVDLAGAELVLKVPRNIARRDATPQMDLYDHLIVVDRRLLTVLTRSEGGYTVIEVPVDRIAAVHDTVNLLAGVLRVIPHQGAPVELHYNGSASEMIRRLVDVLVRGAASGGPNRAGQALIEAGRTAAGPMPVLDLGRDDQGLLGDLRDAVRARPSLRPWVGHGRQRVRTAGGWALTPTTVQAAVLAEDDGVLEVFTRHEWVVTGRAPVHSSGRWSVPLAALSGIGLAPDPRYAGVVHAVLRIGDAQVVLILPQDSAAQAVIARAAHLTGASPYGGR